MGALASALSGLGLVAQLSLSHWGLQSVDEIGYVSVGIMHDKGGDRMIVYQVKKEKPDQRPVAAPLSRDPNPQGRRFVVARFDCCNRDTLGGYFKGFFKAPAKAEVSIGARERGRASLVFDYQKSAVDYAGFWIHLFDSTRAVQDRVYFDSTSYQTLSFDVRADSDNASFALQALDNIYEAKQDSLRVGNLGAFVPAGKLTTTWQHASVPLNKVPITLNRKFLAGLVFIVDQPQGEGKLYLRNLAFNKAGGDVGTEIEAPKPVVMPKPKLDRALWLWETQTIQSDPKEIQALAGYCKKAQISDLFIQVPYEAKQIGGEWQIEWDEDKTRNLVRVLNQAGVRVHALDGGRGYALTPMQGRQIALLERLIAFNKKNPAAAFFGVRFDNEFHLLPEYWGVAKADITAQFIEHLKKIRPLSTRGKMVFGVDLPFWIEQSTFALIFEQVDNVGLMDYRTVAYGPDGVIAHAEDSIMLAQTMKKRVFVGLETVPLPNETIYEFARDANGEPERLRVKALDGDSVALEISQSKGSQAGLPLLRKIQVPASKITFFGMSPAALEQVIRQSERELSRYKSFAGIALHSYESLRPKNRSASPSLVK